LIEKSSGGSFIYAEQGYESSFNHIYIGLPWFGFVKNNIDDQSVILRVVRQWII